MFELDGTTRFCEMTLDELANLPLQVGEVSSGSVLAMVSAEARAHLARCRGCLEAVEQLVESRNVMLPLVDATIEPGPWFVTRVMAAIEAQERQEEREGVWASVRRLAPRLVAFCTLLLVLGGTWAVRVRRTELQQRDVQSASEALFDPAGGVAFNDDVMTNVSASEARQ